MMGDKFQRQAFRRRPGQGKPCRSKRPGFEIGQIRGQRAQRVFAHALAGEMAQGLDIVLGDRIRGSQ